MATVKRRRKYSPETYRRVKRWRRIKSRLPEILPRTEASRQKLVPRTKQLPFKGRVENAQFFLEEANRWRAEGKRVVLVQGVHGVQLCTD